MYLQKPYTDYAIENGMEVAAAELIGFAKTDELAPGASQRLTITVESRTSRPTIPTGWAAICWMLERTIWRLDAMRMMR